MSSAELLHALEANRLQQEAIKRKLQDLQRLQMRVNILISIAIENSMPPVREERRRDQTNAPFRSTEVHPLRCPHRRPLGEPFFTDLTGEVAPACDAEELVRSHLARARRFEVSPMRWSTTMDNNLLLGVVRVARAHLYKECFEALHITFPERLKPLGSCSLPSMTDAGPRVETQFSDDFDFSSLPEISVLSSTTRAQLLTALRKVREKSDDDVIAEAQPDALDWVRVCHGGFLPTNCKASPYDCKVRFCSHFQTTNKSKWTEDEDTKLENAAQEHHHKNWKAIAAEVGNGRTALQCAVRFLESLPVRSPSAWSEYEDQCVKELVKEFGTGDWSLIADSLPGKTAQDIQKRWVLQLDPTLTPLVPWSHEEEAKLRILIKMHGETGWYKIMAYTPGRADNSNREHFLNVMQRAFNHSAFTKEEDDRILQLAAEYEKTVPWQELAHRLGTNRSNNQVYRRWKVLARKSEAAPGGH